MAFEYQGFATLGVNLNRQKYGPLDISNVFTSENDLKYYLTKGAHTTGVSKYWYESADKKVVPYPYEGQVLATVIDGVVNVYALSLDAEGNFQTQEIAGKIEVDGTTIKLNADGKLELVGIPVDIAGKTLVPSLVNGVLTWAEPDTSTAEGQAQEIEGLKARATALEGTVGNAEAGLVKDVADNKSAIEQEAADRAAADATLEGKIAEALQAAKDYADTNDANTIYDDTSLQNRVKAIEDDYLKAADKYDDGEVRSLISALDTAVGNNENGLVKDVADNKQAITDEKSRAEAAEQALSERINAIDFIDPDELADAIKDFAETAYVDGEIDKLEAAIAALNHFKAEVVDNIDKVTELGVLYLIKDESVAGVDKYNEYIVVDGKATLIGDTTTDLSNYYNKTEIDGKVDTINTAVSDEKAAREALAERVGALEDIDNATRAELEEYKAKVVSDIATAKSEAISDADSKLANKVNTSDFETFKGENETAISAAKDAAIASAKTETETQVGALETAIASNYATKSELSAHEAAINNELLAYAKTVDVNAELAKKVESATIAHAVAADPDNGVEAIPEGVTKEGTTLKIVVDAPTRAETAQMIADKIKDIAGEDSIPAVKADLEAEIQRSTAKDEAHDAALATLQGDASKAGSVAEAKALAQKGVDDAATVAADLVTANAAIADNTREIGVAKGSIETVNTTLSGKISDLESKDSIIESDIAALKATVSGETTGHTSRIVALEGRATALETRDTELAGLIATKANSADVYTKTEVDNKVAAAVGGVDLTPYAKTADVDATVEAINASIATKANAADVYTKDEAKAEFMNQDEVDARINALIVGADPEGGKTITDIQNLVKYVDENAGEIAALITTVDGHTETIAEHTQKLIEIDAAIVALVQPKASAEISVADDGALGIIEVSTDKLVQGSMTLVLNGGDAGVVAE